MTIQCTLFWKIWEVIDYSLSFKPPWDWDLRGKHLDILNDWQKNNIKKMINSSKVLIGVLENILPLNCLMYTGQY